MHYETLHMTGNMQYETLESRNKKPQHFPLAHSFLCPQERSKNYNNQEAFKNRSKCFKS